ncbi:hypothetical protein GLW02_05285 [Halomonas sp. 22501_18_FS]|uniref:Transmembrane protein n=1 Tax=Vreelandella halophila TaxID=86177 RepID=A0A9X4YBP8_9GAMM|nr:hypothetical protein F3089_02930 [Halospina sp. K52047b]MYL26947.1 hypothetical protein [Halomonas utahensis]MYL74208.1 hypothetical protein [Halomonas sp. 22501_18_FS]
MHGQSLTSQNEHTETSGSRPRVEAYWVERKRYLEEIRGIPELRRRYVNALAIYLIRRILWSFGFFPVFLGFWIPLVFARFNPVALVDNALPHLERFVDATAQVQATTLETLVLSWLSVGLLFAVFDLVLTPFKSPYEYEADVHMRAWEELQQQSRSENA